MVDAHLFGWYAAVPIVKFLLLVGLYLLGLAIIREIGR